jgi:hypothetical protein
MRAVQTACMNKGAEVLHGSIEASLDESAHGHHDGVVPGSRQRMTLKARFMLATSAGLLFFFPFFSLSPFFQQVLFRAESSALPQPQHRAVITRSLPCSLFRYKASSSRIK